MNDTAAHTGWLHEPLRLCSGLVALAALGVLLLVAWRRGRHASDAPAAVASAAWAASAAAIALGLNHLVTHAVARPRPYVAMPAAHVLVARATDFSFPSAHAAIAGAVVAALWFSDRAVAGAATAVAVVLGFARVYVGIQYPGDVAGGLLLGAAVAVVLRPVGMLVLGWLAVRVERSPLHRLVAAPVPDPDLVSLSRSPT